RAPAELRDPAEPFLGRPLLPGPMPIQRRPGLAPVTGSIENATPAAASASTSSMTPTTMGASRGDTPCSRPYCSARTENRLAHTDLTWATTSLAPLIPR